MYRHSSSRPPPYSQQRYSSGSEHSASSPSSSQWPYTVHREETVVKTSNQHPSFLQSDTGSADNSFRRTLLEIEDTYYRTFPDAAQADGYQPRWRMTSGNKERTDESSIGFFSHTSGTRVGVTPQPYASGYPGFSSQPAPYRGGSPARGYGVGDVPMGDSTVRATTHTLAEAYQHPFSVPPAMSSASASHGTYEVSRMPQAEPSIAKALCPSDPAPSSLSPSYDANVVNGPLSDASRGQERWRGAQDNFSTPYVNSNSSGSEDARVPPMGSLGYPEGPLRTAPAASLARVAPQASQYPAESLPRAISIPPSPLRLTPTSYYLAVSTGDPNPTNHAEEAYHSPDPGSPSSITLYPVPQAPLNHHHTIPSWSPHQISPEPVPAPREASVSRSTKRKRGKDSDKKPPLACLFCRGRKIACGPPPPDGDGKTCNQCHRRSLKCEYPAESRRGMRKEKSIPNLNTGGAKVVVKNKKR